jgi:hypothetical protein
MEQRRLPRAGAADDRHELTGADVEIDAVQDPPRESTEE